jgi:hypothetical protein
MTMALHPLELPREAALLFRVVVLLKRLFCALAESELDPTTVDTGWLQHLWQCQDAEWTRRFCLGGQEGRIQAIAHAPLLARSGIRDEFVRQNKVHAVLVAGGDFRDLTAIPGMNDSLAETVKVFLTKCYDQLGSNGQKWPGFAFSGGRLVHKQSYTEGFQRHYPASTVCPYCDGENQRPDLDHYLPKSKFALLACSPWNLVPVCQSCNNLFRGKGDSPALTKGAPRPMDQWLHPFFRPASKRVCIRLSGSPQASIPRLYSPDADEQVRLDNHAKLVQDPPKSYRLYEHWTRLAATYHNRLVARVRRERTATVTPDVVVTRELDAHMDDRGKLPSSMIKAAVCQAILDRKPEYYEEFDDANEVGLT